MGIPLTDTKLRSHESRATTSLELSWIIDIILIEDLRNTEIHQLDQLVSRHLQDILRFYVSVDLLKRYARSVPFEKGVEGGRKTYNAITVQILDGQNHLPEVVPGGLFVQRLLFLPHTKRHQRTVCT